MTAGRVRTRRGRARADRSRRERRQTALWQRGVLAPPLFDAEDHGDPIVLTAADVRASDPDRWIEPFLAANHAQLNRMHFEVETRASGAGVQLALRPGDRIGAIPLQSPTTRRVAAGLLIRPRFGWPSVGAVLSGVGFRVEPDLGGAPLVPGSAREVPTWILAGPVLTRLAALVRRFSRRFAEMREVRESPRGRIDWSAYARHSLPTGAWHRLPCVYPDLQADPWLLATLRWTLRRLATDLESTADSAAGRALLERTRELLHWVGTGAERRPATAELERSLGDPLAGDFLRAALEGIGWVRDERGLGGSRSLDGLAWSLATDQLWEAWSESVVGELARRLGARLETAPEGSTRRPLVWRTTLHTLGHLAPDLALRFSDRTVWIDAKYKAHWIEIHRRGWAGVPEAVREAHRADLHQALAYAALADTDVIETWLVYPIPARDEQSLGEPALSHAEIIAGGRRVALRLAGLPFGFSGPAQRSRVLQTWEEALRGAG